MSILPPAEDDERTQVPSNSVPSGTAAERNAEGEYAHNALPIGARLAEFEIIDQIGQGGFSIVYLVYDHSLQRKVALKEYMPSSLAARVGDTTVAARSERHADAFAAGLRSFIKEARELAQFDHPSLLKVHRFWEANGTGYMVMPFYEGRTLKQALSQHDIRPGEIWLKSLLAHLLDAVEVLHGASPPCLHRDISPDNIMLLREDRPLLLDFGAARRVISDMAQAFTVVLKPGYAPIEQYAEEPSTKQGPWTDIYALAAVIYFVVTGRAPMPSVARLESDTLVPLSKAGAGRYSSELLRAVDRALSVKPQDRPQSVAAFRRLLGFGQTVATPTLQFEHRRSAETSALVAADSPGKRWIWLAAIGVIAVAAIGAAVWWGIAERDNILSASSKPPNVAPKTDVQVESPSPPPRAPQPGSQNATLDSPSSGGSTPPIPPGPKKRPYDPLTALAEVYEARNPQHLVTVAVETPQVNFKKEERMAFSVSSSKPGFVYVLEVGVEAGGNSSLMLLFPNSVDRNNRISPDRPMPLPRASWPVGAGGPSGIDRFLVIVSDSEREFAAAGMRRVGKTGYGEFSGATAARLYESYAGVTPLFAGETKCRTNTQPCSESYGAAEFSIEEVDR